MIRHIIYSFLLLLMTSSHGFCASFVEGNDYVVLTPSSASHTPHQPTLITEFFSFGCPWCYRLESGLNAWAKQQGAHISYQKIPVIFHKNWAYYAKAYYTAEALSQSSTLNPRLFKAILDDKRNLASTEAMIQFFTEQGVDPATAKSAFTSSPSIDMAVTAGQEQMARDQVQVVPSVVVDGRFKTDLQMAKTETRLFAILDFLIMKSCTNHKQRLAE